MEYSSKNLKLVDTFDSLIQARIKMQGDCAHHLEIVCNHNNVDWINHSMSTSIDLTWQALRDVPGPMVLIIGGIDQAEDHEKLSNLIQEKVVLLICLGSKTWKYFKTFSEQSIMIVTAKEMKEAVYYAALIASNKTQTVLFAPSCPSYDAFDNYKNRGNAFRNEVLELFKK